MVIGMSRDFMASSLGKLLLKELASMQNILINDTNVCNDNVIQLEERTLFIIANDTALQEILQGERKVNMQSGFRRSKIIYIIQGLHSNIEQVTWLQMHARCPILITSDENDTVQNILSMIKSCAPVQCHYKVDSTVRNAATWHNALVVIYGVTSNMANAIKDSYPTLDILMKTYRRIENPEHILAKIKYITFNGKTKNVGPCCSERIYNVLTNTDPRYLVNTSLNRKRTQQMLLASIDEPNSTIG